MSAEFRVERARVLRAPPETVFAQVDDLEAWPRWSPWARLDPAMRTTYGPVRRGKGAVSSWEGNSKVGAGRMEILESQAPLRLRFRLDFLRPFAATNSAEFEFRPEDGGTRVTWAMSGRKHPLVRIMSLFMDMDAMVGRQFEEGLANLAELVEK